MVEQGALDIVLPQLVSEDARIAQLALRSLTNITSNGMPVLSFHYESISTHAYTYLSLSLSLTHSEECVATVMEKDVVGVLVSLLQGHPSTETTEHVIMTFTNLSTNRTPHRPRPPEARHL